MDMESALVFLCDTFSTVNRVRFTLKCFKILFFTQVFFRKAWKIPGLLLWRGMRSLLTSSASAEAHPPTKPN